MRTDPTIPKYNIVAKFFHWISVLLLIIQIPLGFYLVDLDFSDFRIKVENIHVLVGIVIFYITLIRILFRLILPRPEDPIEGFSGQMFIARVNHFLLYLSLILVTSSGILKKLFNGESLNFLFFKLKMKTDFDKADLMYEMHVYFNYVLIGLVSLHILAVLFHVFVLKDNVIKRIL